MSLEYFGLDKYSAEALETKAAQALLDGQTKTEAKQIDQQRTVLKFVGAALLILLLTSKA